MNCVSYMNAIEKAAKDEIMKRFDDGEEVEIETKSITLVIKDKKLVDFPQASEEYRRKIGSPISRHIFKEFLDAAFERKLTSITRREDN